MRVLRPIGEDEMVATFLRAELGSERYGAKLRELLARDGRDETVLRDPDLASIGDNEYRLGLLEEHRAYGRREGLFLGFPSLWNVVAFYLFLLHPPPALATLGVAILIALTFAPFHVLHPIRVVRLRWLTLWLLGAWAVLAVYTLACDFAVGAPIIAGLCAIAAYVVGSDAVIRQIKSFNA